jgi:hypothetical protein
VNERIDGSGGRGGEPLSPLRTEAKAALRQAQNLRWLSSSEKLLYWHDLSLESHFAPVAVGGRPHQSTRVRPTVFQFSGEELMRASSYLFVSRKPPVPAASNTPNLHRGAYTPATTLGVTQAGASTAGHI